MSTPSPTMPLMLMHKAVEVTRKVTVVDSTAPIITLLGDAELTMNMAMSILMLEPLQPTPLTVISVIG